MVTATDWMIQNWPFQGPGALVSQRSESHTMGHQGNKDQGGRDPLYVENVTVPPSSL
jgi:hypothetical protein